MNKLHLSTDLFIEKARLPSVIFIMENDKGEFSGLGSGFLVQYKSKKFVLSCEHVIRPFFEKPKAGIYLDHDINKIISRSDIISNNVIIKPYDIGYLMLRDDIDIDKKLFVKAPEQFELSNVTWKNAASLVFGYPGELMERGTLDKAHIISGFSLLGTHTFEHDDRIRDYFEYPEDADIQNGDLDKVPDPPGMSGSAIWRCEFQPYQPLDYENAKVFAIQHSWNFIESQYIGTKIGYILNLIDDKEKL